MVEKVVSASAGMSTIVVGGDVVKVTFEGHPVNYVFIRHVSGEVLVSRLSNVTDGIDGTVKLSTGGYRFDVSAPVIYISGSGVCEVSASALGDFPFKVSGKGGETPDLSAYAKKTDVPSIKVNSAGNADTVNGHSVGVDVPADAKFTDSFVGGNLLDNPDFKINQRGVSGTVSAEGGVIQKFVDRWIIFEGSATINSNGTIILNGTMVQYLENAVGTDVVASSSAGTAEYDDSLKMYVLSASGEVISWAKLEHGSVATPFIAPDLVEELMKCQRYFVVVPYGRYLRASFVGTSVMQFLLPLPVSMVNAPSIVSGTMGVIPLNMSNGEQADTEFAFSITGIKNNILTIQATKSNSANDGALFVTEALLLSADL